MKKRKKYLISVIFVLLFLYIFCYAAGKTVSTLLGQRKSRETFAELNATVNAVRQQVSSEPQTSSSAETAEEEENRIIIPEETAPAVNEDGILLQYAGIYEQNPDTAGWLYIDGTSISYPVMYTPYNPEYYLRRGFDEKHSENGVPFIGEGYSEGGYHTIIYGHNMKDGSMFAPLLSYADPEFWLDHAYIGYDTLYAPGEYEVLAAFYSKAYYQSDTGVFRYYQYTDLSDETTFYEYLNNVYASALYDTGVTAVYGDTLLTLSTCSYHDENGRFVVVAKKIH